MMMVLMMIMMGVETLKSEILKFFLSSAVSLAFTFSYNSIWEYFHQAFKCGWDWDFGSDIWVKELACSPKCYLYSLHHFNNLWTKVQQQETRM